MYCIYNNKNQYRCFSEPPKPAMYPSFIEIIPRIVRPTPTSTPTSTSTLPQFSTASGPSDAELLFVHTMIYVVIPLLYTIVSTRHLGSIMTLWRYIRAGFFNAFKTVENFLLGIIFETLRVLGLYSFSTYTVVKNGREIYSASSEYYLFKTTKDNAYYMDHAKYKICKWIDRQCELYMKQNDGDEPELTETHNDIYDFILHTFDHTRVTRVHRGDFNANTHTLITTNYRMYSKAYQILDNVELSLPVPVPSSMTNDNTDDNIIPSVRQIININMKYPNNFYMEKNVVLDKKFLQWILFSRMGRPDLSEYIAKPHCHYEVTMFYTNKSVVKECQCMCASTSTNNKVDPLPAYFINDSHFVLIGSQYIVKVDSILRCPVFGSSERQVFDIDDILANYYDCSDSESESESDTSDNDAEAGAESDNDDESSAVTDPDMDLDDDAVHDERDGPDADAGTGTNNVCDVDPEFEIIET